MFPRAKSVRHVKDHELEVTFADGETRLVPLWDEIVRASGELVRPLRDVSYFEKVTVSSEGGHLEWPNGYDIDPDVLYWLATGTPITLATDTRYHRPPPHLQTSQSPRPTPAPAK